METLKWSGSLAELEARLKLLPAALAGKVPQAYRSATAVGEVIGIEALTLVREDFIKKSRSQPGVDGRRWVPLTPETIIARKHKELGRRSRDNPRPSLSSGLDKLWRSTFMQALPKGKTYATATADQKQQAAVHAWAVVKSKGGVTLKELYAKAEVAIGIDNGLLVQSLQPGGPRNIMDPTPGNVRIGSSVNYAGYFHGGQPTKRVPARPIAPKELPEPWGLRIADVMKGAVVDVVKELMAF